MVGAVPLGGGRTVSYLAYIAPALLATSAMNGAVIEAGVNFFIKITGMKLYDAILNTPVTPIDIAVGELAWSMVRGGIYSAAFLALMVGLHLTGPLLAAAALSATFLVGSRSGRWGSWSPP